MSTRSKPSHTFWLLLAAVVLIAVSLIWWQRVAASCDGPVVRGMWNEPVCTEVTR